MSALDPRPAGMRDALLAGANRDGGWGYYAGRGSRLEPTCWALLALLPLRSPFDDMASRLAGASSDFFTDAQQPDGLLLEHGLAEEHRPNLAFNGLAALLWSQHPTLTDSVRQKRLLSAISASKGVKLASSPASSQDNTLQAWAWIETTFSWVEPTCWCVLALKRAMRAEAPARARIDEAERLLRNRACQAGGWNAGNADVMGQGLHPYVPTTALGLIALQDRRDDSTVRAALAYLVEHRVSEQSGMALALTLICFRLYGLPVADLEQRLLEQWDHTAFLGNFHVIAMALYSLTAGQHAASAFRV